MNSNEIQTNFIGGELTPLLAGRVDVERYRMGCQVLRNWRIHQFGGVSFRPGTGFRAAAKHADRRSILVPYVYSQTQAYMLELGHLYLRVYKDGAQVGPGYEVATPYPEGQLYELDFVQSADTMIITHRSHHPRRLRRFGDANWRLDLVPADPPPVAEIGRRPAGTLTIAGGVATLAPATVGAGFVQADVGRNIVAGTGTATIASLTDEFSVNITVTEPFDGSVFVGGQWTIDGSPRSELTPSIDKPVGEAIQLTADIGTWRASDVGSIVKINGGSVRITAVNNTTDAIGTILAELAATLAAPADAWVLESSLWNPTDGYPATAAFSEQRLIFGGQPGQAQSIEASVSGESFNFTPGTLDTDGFVRKLESDEQTPIEYLRSDSALVALTYGTEFIIRGGIEKPVTPTNISVKAKQNNGCARVRPVRAGSERVFVQRTGRQVLAMFYAEENDTYGTEDLGLLSEHLFGPGVIQLAYQRRPVPTIYAVLADGRMAVATFDRAQNVVAWSPWETDGAFESVAVTPGQARDEVWVSVRRTVGGLPVRHIERFEESFEALRGRTGFDYGYTLDSAIVADSAVPFTAVTGLGHLEGRTVGAVADGYFAGDFVVAGGQIVLPHPAYRALVGLRYTATLIPMPPELRSAGGSSRGRSIRSVEAFVQLHRSMGGSINGSPLPTRAFGPNVLDQPPPLFTGEKPSPGVIGWERGKALVTIEQDKPLPMHILSIIHKLVVNP